ncbi:MAG: STAS domain-containing protein [Actinomycetota bacterium]
MSEIYRLSVVEGPGGAAVARIEGEIDLASAPTIGADLAAQIGRGVQAIDLTDVEFIDSAGVRMLVELARAAQEDRPLIAIVAPVGSTARRMLELTGIEPLFTVLDSAAALPTRAT